MSAAFSDNPEFAKLLAGQDDGVNMTRLLLEFAADAYPGLDSNATLVELDRLGQAAHELLCQLPSASVAERLQVLGQLLYEKEGFRGNQESYYDPRNSYLNDVVTRRLGIPITLSLVYTAVGRYAGLKLFGVGSPGHFVVGCHGGGETLYIDPFSDGEVLDEAACARRIENVLGQKGVVTSEHFRAASSREIAARVLRNLKAAHAMRDAWTAALPVQLRLVALLPDVLDERRDLGLIYLRNNDPHPAAQLLEEYVRQAPPAAAEPVIPFLRTAHRAAAERN